MRTTDAGYSNDSGRTYICKKNRQNHHSQTCMVVNLSEDN